MSGVPAPAVSRVDARARTPWGEPVVIAEVGCSRGAVTTRHELASRSRALAFDAPAVVVLAHTEPGVRAAPGGAS